MLYIISHTELDVHVYRSHNNGLLQSYIICKLELSESLIREAKLYKAA